jgi:group I intron endonuclease
MQVISGVYMIVNKINGKRYVGSAVNLEKRWKEHLYALRGGYHTIRFQRSYNKYGEKSFEFIIMEEVKDKNQLIPREQTWLDWYKSYLPENGYNINRIANSVLGLIHSEKSKQQMSISKKGMVGTWLGRKHSKETRERMSLDRKGEGNNRWGKHHSDETKEGIRASNSLTKKGKPPSEKAKKANYLRRGKPLPEETKRKMREKWLDPEYKKMRVDKIRERWADPNYKKMVLDKRKQKQLLVA